MSWKQSAEVSCLSVTLNKYFINGFKPVLFCDLFGASDLFGL